MNHALPLPLLLRFASRLRNHLTATSPPLSSLPDAQWSELLETFSRIRHAQERNWHLAGRHLRIAAACLLESLQKRLEECRNSLPMVDPGWIASLSEIVSDLRALPGEFADVHLELRKRRFSVVTDDIVLESVSLGPFRITLELSEYGRQLPSYFVEALEPTPSADDDRTVHPHVHDGHLCEGEGKVAIRQALRQGRLFDFFVLLRQVLETYNAGSAYSSLSDWVGRNCQCCSRRTSEDESTSCDRCGHHICFDCSTGCERCERYCCDSCYTTCHACGDSICVSCSNPCSVCHTDYCERCLTHSTCSSCKPDKELHSDEQASAENPAIEKHQVRAETQVHSLGVGEIAVPA